jgi:hypothetical protein
LARGFEPTTMNVSFKRRLSLALRFLFFSQAMGKSGLSRSSESINDCGGEAMRSEMDRRPIRPPTFLA